jgi:hypothetical protein
VTFTPSIYLMVTVAGTTSIDCNFVHSGCRPTKVYIFGKSSSRSLQKYILLWVYDQSMRRYNTKCKEGVKVTGGFPIKKNCYITVSNNDRTWVATGSILSPLTSSDCISVHNHRRHRKLYIFGKYSSRSLQKCIVLLVYDHCEKIYSCLKRVYDLPFSGILWPRLSPKVTIVVGNRYNL